MNRTYRLIFNRSIGLWQVVSELARGHGKGRGQSSTVSMTSSGATLPVLRPQTAWMPNILWAAVLSTTLVGQAHADFSQSGQILWDSDIQSTIIGETSAGSQTVEDIAYPTSYNEPRNVILGHKASGSGTITVSDDGSRYNMGSYQSAPYLMTVGNAGTGTVNLFNSGRLELNSGRMLLGAQAQGQGTLNIGAAPGATPGKAGSMNAASIEFGPGKGTINFNITDTHTFTPTLMSSPDAGPTQQINQLAGTTILEADSQAFTGKTTVAGGKLLIKKGLGGGMKVTGGTLQFGDGYIGFTNTVQSMSVQGSGSTLTVYDPVQLVVSGSADLASDTTLDLRLTKPEVHKNALVTVTGELSIGQNVTLELNNIASDRTLITALDGIKGDFSNFNVVDTSPDQVDYLTVQLVKSTDNTQLRAAYDLSWNAKNSMAHGTFTLAQASDSYTVSTDLEDQPSNSAKQWDGKTLTKAGEGTLTLSGNNSYTGGTVLTGGTIAVERDENLGAASGPLSLNQATLATSASFDSYRQVTLHQAGEFQLASGTTLGLNNTVSGSGTLIKSGDGTLALNTQNSYEGGTLLKAGTVQIKNDGNLGEGSGNITFQGGSLETTGSFSSTRGITLTNAGQIATAANTNVYLHGSITGPGDLIKTGSGTLHLSGNANAYGNTHIQAGKLIVNTDSISGRVRNQGELVFDQVADGRFDKVISGTGSVRKEGTGTVELGAINIYSGNMTIAQGTLLVSHDTNLGLYSSNLILDGGTLATKQEVYLDRYVQLAQNGRVNVAADGILHMNNTVSGSGALITIGKGTLQLNADNTYTNGTELNGGKLRVARDESLGDAAGNIRLNGGSLVATQSFASARSINLASADSEIEVLADQTLALNGKLFGSNQLAKQGSGTLTLNADNTYSGGTTLNGGTLGVSRDTNLGDSKGGLVFNGGILASSASFDSARTAQFKQDAQWNVADNSTLHLSGELSGSGALLKTGNGTLRLSGENTYQGGTAIHEGTLEVAQDAHLGDASGSIRLHGGTLHATDSFASARQIELDQQETITVSSGATLNLTGTIEGTGALHQKGGGTMVLSGTNSYEGGTTLHEGRLVVSQDSNLGTGALSFQGGTFANTASFDTARQITLNNKAHLDVAADTELGLSGQISGSGHLIKEGTGTLRLDNTANRYGSTQILAGTLICNAGSLSGNVLNQGALVFEQSWDGRFQGELSGAGSLLKTGTGNLTLSGNNTRYTGHSTVSEGTLTVLDALGGSASVKNAALQFGDGVSGGASHLSGDLNIEGAGSSLSVQGPATLSVDGTVDLHDNTVLDIAAGNSGPALQADRVTVGEQVTFTLGGISHEGQLDKVLVNTHHGIQGDFASIQVGGFNGTVDYLNLNTRKSADQTQLLASYGLSWTANNNLAHGTFTLSDESDRFVVNTDLKDQHPNSATGWNGSTLHKAGAGTLVLSGQNSYTGGTTLADGRLQVSQDANLGAASGGLSFQGGTLVTTDSFNSTRDIALLDDGTLEINNDSTLGLNGTVSGTAALIKEGNGTLVLNGNNRYLGDTLLNQGTVQVAGDANLGDSKSSLVFNGGTLAATDSFNSARSASFQHDANWKVADGATLGLSGTLSGTGALIKSGTGTLALSGQNSYQGGTVITDGAVQVSQDANLGDISGQLSLHNGTLAVTDSFASVRQIELEKMGAIAVDTNANLSLNGVITGTGSLKKTGKGSVELNGTNTYEGGTTLHEGRLIVSQDSNLGTGALDLQGGTFANTASFDTARQITLNNKAHLDVAADTELGLSGQISGSGHLIKEGTGTLRLDNTANRYGSTQILAGTVIGNAGSLSGNVLNQGALVFEQSWDGRFQGELSGAGSLLKTGTGNLTLSGNSSRYTGHSTVSEGTLTVLDTLGGSVSVKNAALQFGDGVSGGASHLSGDLNIEGAGSTLSVQGPATLSVDGTVDLHDNTVLDIAAGPNSPALHADRVILGENVAFTLGGISHEGQLDKVLVTTNHGIQGEFASVQVGGFNGAVDYLNLNTHKSADQTQLLASYGLSWTTNNNLAHGTFTLSDASDRFVVGTALKDQTPNSATAWNGSTLHKAGAGTLVLSGQNSYTGGTTLADGRLQVSQDANLGAASGGLSFQGGTLATTSSFTSARDIALLSDGRFEVDADTTLSLDGAVVGQADLIKSGAGSLRLNNQANNYLHSRIEEGSLIAQAATLSGSVENNGTLIFDQASDDAYAGGISGTGSLIKDGSGTLSLTGDNSAFRGDTAIVAGRLTLNGKLGGSSTIGAGSVLGGSGVIGSGAGSSITVAEGGTLSPGNSIGTLTINGDLHVQPGARLIVETQPQGTAADLIKVTGKTSLSGGSVAHIGANGNYDLRSSYTILASEGVLSGEFGDVTSDFAFLRPSLSYDYQNGQVSLVLERNDQVMDSAAQTRNQRASANAIESIGLHANHAVYDAIAQLPNDPDLLRASFDGLSGELHASAKTVLQEDSRQLRDTVNERLRSASRAVAAQTAPVRNNQGQLAASDSTGTHSWIQGMGSWRSADATDNTARVSSSSSGFLMGVDTNVSESARVGVLAGFSRSDIKLRDRSSSASSDNYHLGAYAGTEWGALGLRGGLAYSWHDLSTRRSVSVPGLSDTLKADYSSQSTQAFAELGYRIEAAAVALEPFAQLAYVHQKSNSFTEKGGAAALHADRQTTNTTFMTLGTRAMTEFELGSTQANVHGSLAWRHAMGTTKPSATHAFSAGSAFTVVGAPIAKNSAMLEAGVDLKINSQAAIGLAYQGQLARSAQDHSVQARLNIRF